MIFVLNICFVEYLYDDIDCYAGEGVLNWYK